MNAIPFVAANGNCLCGRYTLLDELGAGGEGAVWRARDHERGIELALKILAPELARSPAAWEALQREFHIARRLDHPRILKLYPPEMDGGVAFLPMELALGGDLRRLRGASYLEVGPVLLEAAEALQYMHERGIVHGDLKPGNVLLDERGHIRLADFGGAAKLLRAEPGAAAPREVRAFPGLGSPIEAQSAARVVASPFTASPERLRGAPPAVADDVYGLGALAYEMLSGHPPHYPRLVPERMHEEPVPALRAAHPVPRRLTALVMAMLSQSAQDRPAGMRSIIDSLEAILNDTLTLGEPTPADWAEDEPAESPAQPAPSGTDPAMPDRPPDFHGLSSAPATAADRAPDPTREAAREPVLSAAAPGALREERAGEAHDRELRELWADMRVSRGSQFHRASEGARRARWPWALGGLVGAIALAAWSAPHWQALARAWAPSSLAPLQRLVPRHPMTRAESALHAWLRSAASVSRAATDGASAVTHRSALSSDAGSTTAIAEGARDSRNSPGTDAATGSAQSRKAALALLVAGLQAEIDHHQSLARLAYERVLSLDPGNAAAAKGLRRVQASVESGERRRRREERLVGEAAPVPDSVPITAQARALPLPESVHSRVQPREVQLAPPREALLSPGADLTRRLRALADDPSGLTSKPIRAEAAALIREERAMRAPGYELKRLAARVAILVREYELTVRVALVSDDRTQVEIPEIGVLGAFLRREIELKPGEYTVIGTRSGYREVDREVTVAPGQPLEVVRVSCEERI